MIRSLTEYCSRLFHISLNQKISNKIEAIQKTCNRFFLDEMYVCYNSALEMCGLQSLHKKRKHQSLKFAKTTHTDMKNIFALYLTLHTHNMRIGEKIMVNKARTEKYKKSTIPFFAEKTN